MAIDYCDLCNEECFKGNIGFKAQEENWRLLVAQALCALKAAAGGEVPATSVATSAVPYAAPVQTLLAANTARDGGTIYNDSDQAIYVKHGAAASSTDFGVKLFPNGYLELIPGYKGVVTGLWAAAATGSARMQEST